MIGVIHKVDDVVGGRYKVENYLNQGGMQEVYVAEDTLLDRRVALKAPKNPSAVKRFKRSAIVSAKVNHSNVAKTLDYFDEGPRSYLIEELVLGLDLSVVLKRYGFIEPHLVSRIFHRLAKGLAASHHVGVIHRDLKPSNIISVAGLVVTDVKITDFGIAKMAEAEIKEAWVNDESLTASQTAIGALPYMAPEMINSMSDVTVASDVWSLGALVIELLSGKKPFGAGLAAVPRIVEAKLPAFPTICLKRQFEPLARELFEIAKLCLVKDADARPSADDVVKKCEELCYIEGLREEGVAKQMNNPYWGFVRATVGNDVFFHRDSLYGASAVKAGQNVMFVRHRGGGSDRAFPIQVVS